MRYESCGVRAGEAPRLGYRMEVLMCTFHLNSFPSLSLLAGSFTYVYVVTVVVVVCVCTERDAIFCVPFKLLN